MISISELFFFGSQRKCVEAIFCLKPAGITTITIIIITSLGHLSTDWAKGLKWCMSQLLGSWKIEWFSKSRHFCWRFLWLPFWDTAILYCLGLAQQSHKAVVTRVTHLEMFWSTRCFEKLGFLTRWFWSDWEQKLQSEAILASNQCNVVETREPFWLSCSCFGFVFLTTWLPPRKRIIYDFNSQLFFFVRQIFSKCNSSPRRWAT